MFGAKTQPEVNLPKPRVTVDVEQFGVAPDEHKKLTSDLGIPDFPSLDSFCRARGIPRYDPVEVHSYLGRIMTTEWGWFPVRERDRIGSREWMFYLSAPGQKDMFSRPSNTRLYDKPIPIPVLLRMKEVTEQFPTVKFYITDEIRIFDRLSDPFLVAILGNERIIIEQWDEPGFNRKELT